VVDYHGLGRRNLLADRLLVRPQLNRGTLGGRLTRASRVGSDHVSRQTEALTDLVARCAEAHPDCGVRLQGSVASGAERPDSDIDLTVVVPGASLVRENDLLWADNHWRMRLVHDSTTGLNLDINWVGVQELLTLVAQRGAAAWFMFLTAVTLRDPSGLVARCETAIANWFHTNPAILAAWHRQQLAVDSFKRDPAKLLEFATQPAFLQHLARSPTASS
jgi:hypothetical protein